MKSVCVSMHELGSLGACSPMVIRCSELYHRFKIYHSLLEIDKETGGHAIDCGSK